MQPWKTVRVGHRSDLLFCMQHRVLGIILEVGTEGKKKMEGEGIDEMTRNA